MQDELQGANQLPESESGDAGAYPAAVPPAERDSPSAAAASVTERGEKVAVRRPEFANLHDSGQRSSGAAMDRFYDVHVPVWVELGRIEMPLGDLMKLDEGAVLRLNRPVGEPVELVSQGVRLARGEVVVIDDCFAVRIKEIESPRPAR